MIVTVSVIIMMVNMIRTVWTTLSHVATAHRTIPYLTRVSPAVYAGATEERLGIGLKQLALLIRLRDRGALPQQASRDYAHATQNTVVVWLNELEDAAS